MTPLMRIEELPEIEEIPPFMTVKDLCDLIRIDEKTAREMIASGVLKSVRVGVKSIRIPRSAVVELIYSFSEKNGNGS